MSTSNIDAQRIQQGKPTGLDTIAHGAHVPCQEDAPYVTAICGARLNWDDEWDAIFEMCVVCRDLLTCPICGAILRMPA